MGVETSSLGTPRDGSRRWRSCGSRGGYRCSRRSMAGAPVLAHQWSCDQVRGRGVRPRAKASRPRRRHIGDATPRSRGRRCAGRCRRLVLGHFRRAELTGISPRIRATRSTVANSQGRPGSRSMAPFSGRSVIGPAGVPDGKQPWNLQQNDPAAVGPAQSRRTGLPGKVRRDRLEPRRAPPPGTRLVHFSSRPRTGTGADARPLPQRATTRHPPTGNSSGPGPAWSFPGAGKRSDTGPIGDTDVLPPESRSPPSAAITGKLTSGLPEGPAARVSRMKTPFRKGTDRTEMHGAGPRAPAAAAEGIVTKSAACRWLWKLAVVPARAYATRWRASGWRSGRHRRR